MSYTTLSNNLRRTGRTTRMLQEAIRLDAAGRAVYVVAAHEMHADFLRYRLTELGGNPYTIKIETPGTLTNLDWETFTLRGAHPNCYVLLDHYTLESRYWHVVNELHRWDGPAPQEGKP